MVLMCSLGNFNGVLIDQGVKINHTILKIMKKKLNEKTLELNITNELLNLSKSFVCYLLYPICHHLFSRNQQGIDIWLQVINQPILFAQGLTQEEESNEGYDVSINYTLSNGQDGRLMFLQYKAGIEKKHSNKPESNFLRQTAKLDNRTPNHIVFTFNDAAGGRQHSALRELASREGIKPQSVMYVFPRITEGADFKNKIGSLIYSSSFVPVLALDNQALGQTPPVVINDGIIHKYRTSYDGQISEVNSVFFVFNYDDRIFLWLVSELICIQIERLVKVLKEYNKDALEEFLDILLGSNMDEIIAKKLNLSHYNNMMIKDIKIYVKAIKEKLNLNEEIPMAPSKFTTIVPKEGLKLTFSSKDYFSTTNFQLF